LGGRKFTPPTFNKGEEILFGKSDKRKKRRNGFQGLDGGLFLRKERGERIPYLPSKKEKKGKDRGTVFEPRVGQSRQKSQAGSQEKKGEKEARTCRAQYHKKKRKGEKKSITPPKTEHQNPPPHFNAPPHCGERKREENPLRTPRFYALQKGKKEKEKKKPHPKYLISNKNARGRKEGNPNLALGL